jgi:hypothetical protein
MADDDGGMGMGGGGGMDDGMGGGMGMGSDGMGGGRRAYNPTGEEETAHDDSIFANLDDDEDEEEEEEEGDDEYDEETDDELELSESQNSGRSPTKTAKQLISSDAESSPASEDEFARPPSPDVPPEYWQVQRLVKYVKVRDTF